MLFTTVVPIIILEQLLRISPFLFDIGHVQKFAMTLEMWYQSPSVIGFALPASTLAVNTTVAPGQVAVAI